MAKPSGRFLQPIVACGLLPLAVMTSEMRRATWRGVDGRLVLRPERAQAPRPQRTDAAPARAPAEPAPAAEQQPAGADPCEKPAQRETSS
jgi:hypothetical protein